MIKFKEEKDIILFASLHPILMMIYCDLFLYAKSKHGIELVITSTRSSADEDRALNRKSKSHLTGRALDFRTNNIDSFILDDIVEYIESKKEYSEFKYLTKDGNRRLVYLHGERQNYHAHLAIHSKYSLQPL